MMSESERIRFYQRTQRSRFEQLIHRQHIDALSRNVQRAHAVMSEATQILKW